jgi:hypothetical protein
MKGGLDESGRLVIVRRGKPKVQDCRFTTDMFPSNVEPGKFSPAGMQCNDHCPLMGDPISVAGEDGETKVTLQICQNRILPFETWFDQRQDATVQTNAANVAGAAPKMVMAPADRVMPNPQGQPPQGPPTVPHILADDDGDNG